MTRRASRHGPLMGLLLASVVSAGALAFFASRDRGAARAPSPSVEEESAAGENEAPSSLDVAAHPPPVREPAPLGASPRSAAQVGSVEVGDVEAYRLPDVVADPAIQEQGVRALAQPLHCAPPSRAVDIRATGPGGIGCRIDSSDGPPVYVGRWAIRTASGILEVGSFEAGLRSGPWTQFYPSGFKAAEGEFVDDKREGVWNEWDDSGRFFARRSYKDGVLDGVTVVFRQPAPDVEIWANGLRPGDAEEFARRNREIW